MVNPVAESRAHHITVVAYGVVRESPPQGGRSAEEYSVNISLFQSDPDAAIERFATHRRVHAVVNAVVTVWHDPVLGWGTLGSADEVWCDTSLIEVARSCKERFPSLLNSICNIACDAARVRGHACANFVLLRLPT